MPGMIKSESETPPTLATSREPKGPIKSGAPGGIGDQALMDAIGLIVISWVVLLLLGFSLRTFNI